MTRILFLHHQQRRPFQEEPGYNEVFGVFKASSAALEYREFVYQSILAKFVDFHYHVLPPVEPELQRVVNAWSAGNADFALILDQVMTIERPDIVVNIMSFGPQSIRPQIFELLRQRGHRFKSVNICFDVEETDWLIVTILKEALQYMDLVLLADDYDAYQRLINGQGVFEGVTHVDRAMWLPFTVDPAIYRKLDIPKRLDVTLFGSSEGQRIDYIRDLRENLGPRFSHMGGYMADDHFLSTEDYVRAINESRVVINTQTSTRRDQIKGRIKEVLSCGSFLLEQDSPNARRFLEGSGVPLFADAAEATHMALYYLDRPRERETAAAHSRAWLLGHHSPDKYVNQILGALGV